MAKKESKLSTPFQISQYSQYFSRKKQHDREQSKLKQDELRKSRLSVSLYCSSTVLLTYLILIKIHWVKNIKYKYSKSIMETMMKIRVNNLVEVAQPPNPEVLHQRSKLAEVKKFTYNNWKTNNSLKQKSFFKFRSLWFSKSGQAFEAKH